ncbi:MAG: PA14 domain-containing protein, partial [Bacteroidota bacterium]
PVQAYFDARYPTALAGQGLVYGDPYTNLDYFDPKVVVPTDLEHSVLHKRLSTVHEDYSMPPLAKYKIDSAGVQTVEDWIQSLSPNYGTALQGQCISFPEIAPQKTSTPSLTLLSSTSSGLPVTYQLVSGPANLAGNVLTFTGTAGEVVVRAVQAGNATYEAAPTIERSFWVNPDAFANGTGLTGRYFDDITLTNQSFSQVDTTIDFQWGSATPNLSLGYEGFSISWEGEIEAPLAETYTFTTSTDDGVRLWVNNQLIIDQWQDQSVTNFTGTVSLPAQTKVPIRMEFYENTVFATARLYWSSPSIPRSIVPKIFLYPNSSVLPIEWQGFAVEEVGDQAQLYWEASSSDMGQEYIIERSENGEEFEFLKSVRPSSSSQTRFEAWDENPLSGTSYYRIKWQNIDGELSYSQIESAFFELFRYQVFPNPLGEGQPITVQLDFDEPQAVEIQVVDIRGRQLVKLRPSGWERRHDLTIATDGWRPGIYFVEILTNRKRITEKILLK